MKWREGINKKTAKKFRTKGGLNYSSREYKNPYFSANKKKRVKFVSLDLTLKTKLILALFLLMIILLFFWIFYSSFFTIKNVLISGKGRISEKNIEKIVYNQIDKNFFILWQQKNIFIFNTNKLAKDLKNKYVFNELTIEKQFPDTLFVNYEEKKYALIWLEDNNYYYSDENGYIITEVNLLEIEQKDYPLIENESESKIEDIKISINTSYLKYSISLFEKFKEYENDFKIEKFKIGKKINTIKIILMDGPELYFNLLKDIDKQINKLVILKQEKLKEDFSNKTYIDLSFGDRVYYR